MVITKTPLRLSIAGGGTDLPSWYSRHGSMFVSGAINKYVYITYHRSLFDKKVRARYSEMEEVNSTDDLKNKILRETFKYYGIKDRVEITSHADIPSGTGLGSSGSFGVGVVKALGSDLSKAELAELATKIQIDKCGFPIGKQDQYVASYGGLNIYKVSPKGYVKVKKLLIDHETLEDRLALFFTGVKRDTNEVLSKSSQEGLEKIQELAIETVGALRDGDLDRYGEVLNEHWEYKKLRGGMTNKKIDEYYRLGLENGATGGKLVGAGGGGFLLFYTRDRKKLIKNMPLEYVPFRFVFEGSKIIDD